MGLQLCSQLSQAQVPSKEWDKTFGGSGSEVVRKVIQTTDGGYLIGGWSGSGVSGDKSQPNQGSDDYWVVKVDAQGTKQWDRTFGGNKRDVLLSVQQTTDGGYILGGESESDATGDKTQPNVGVLYTTDYWIVKLDATGNKQWDRTYGGSSREVFYSVQQTADKGYILGGWSLSGISGDKSQAHLGNGDYWVLKLDATGNKQWDRTFGGTGTEFLIEVQQRPNGGYLLAGLSSSPAGGDKTQPSQGNIDYWLLQLDSQGNKQWDRTYGGNKQDFLRALVQTADGGYVLGGYSESDATGDKNQPSQGRSDFWLVKVDAAGTQQWDRTFGGAGTEILSSIRQTSDGSYLLGGHSTSDRSGDKSQPGQGDFDYWLVKINTMGTKQWDLALGGNKLDALPSLQQTSDGGYILGGNSASDVSPDKSQPSQGSDDFWLVKLSAERLVTATQTRGVQAGLQLYPNPAHTHFTLHLPSHAPRAGLRLSVLDARGEVVRTQLLTVTEADVPVEIGPHPAGLYLLRVEGPNSFVATQRVILQ